MTTTTRAPMTANDRRAVAAAIKSAVDTAIVGGEFPALAGCKVRVSGRKVGSHTSEFTVAVTGFRGLLLDNAVGASLYFWVQARFGDGGVLRAFETSVTA